MADQVTSDTTLAKLVEAMVALNANVQSATQTSQQVNQSIADLLTKLSAQVSSTTTTTQVAQEETGFGERFQVENVDRSTAWAANWKRTYDEYQDVALNTIRQGQRYAEKVLSDAQTFDNQRQNIATQALVNAVETANMVGKQAVRHGDVAIDRQWNVDEQNTAVASIWNNETFKEAIRGAVAAAVADSMKKSA